MSKKEAAKLEEKALAVSQPSAELLERINDVKENLAAVENFKLPRIKSTPGGFEITEGEDTVNEMDVVILHARKTNVFYAKPYNSNEVTPPDCFSQDGLMPDSSVANPQNKTCKGCPKAEFGTNSMSSGKACRNLKPIYLLLSDESIIPRQLTVAPTSLKAANAYLMDLTERGIPYRKVKTKITAYKDNPKDTYIKLKFSRGEKLDAARAVDVDYLRAQWLPVMNNQVAEQAEASETAKNIEPAKGGDF